MTTQEATWSSRDQTCESSREPPEVRAFRNSDSVGSMYTRHSGHSTPRVVVPQHRSSYTMSSRNAHQQPVPAQAAVNRKREQKRYVIEDFRHAFERKGMELDTSRKLGRGKYSKVYKAVDKVNRRMVAVKAIDIFELTADVKNKFLPREISCWRKLKNPFIVGLHAQYEAQNMIFLAMEYGSQGDLLRFVQENGGIAEQKAGRFMSQLMRGLEYMHSRQIAHRDIKLENIIMFDNCVKLSDFGFVRHVESHTFSHTFCGSKSYSAPELLRGIGYNPFLSDVWSLGVVGFVMVTNRMPFDEKKPNTTIVDLQRHRRYVIPSSVSLSYECISSFESMMTFDVTQRPTSSQCLSLPWIRPHLTESVDRRSG